MIKEDFLQQNGYSSYDNYCPFTKTRLMLRNIIWYFDKCKDAITNHKLSWSTVRKESEEVFYGLMKMKFEIADDGMESRLDRLYKQIEEVFSRMLG